MRCDCGGEKARTPHSDWCSTNGKPPKEWRPAPAADKFQTKWAAAVNKTHGNPPPTTASVDPDANNPDAWQIGDVITYQHNGSGTWVDYVVADHVNLDVLRNWVKAGTYGPPRRVKKAYNPTAKRLVNDTDKATVQAMWNATFRPAVEKDLEAIRQAVVKRRSGVMLSKTGKVDRQAPLTFKVSDGGAISIYGLQRFPVTLYPNQLDRLLRHQKDLVDFVLENRDKLKP